MKGHFPGGKRNGGLLEELCLLSYDCRVMKGAGIEAIKWAGEAQMVAEGEGSWDPHVTGRGGGQWL